MKGKIAFRVLIGLLIFSAIVSCKSAPTPEEGTSETRPVDEGVVTPRDTTPADPNLPSQLDLSTLEAAAARAAAARKMADDFSAPDFFPSEWQEADSLYAQAESGKRTSTRAEAQDSIARYNRAADAFDALVERSLAVAYGYAERELAAAREELVAAGAVELAPDFLLDADNTVDAAEDKYKAKDYYAAKADAEKALSMYTTLKTGLDAYKLREEIANRGFEVYGPSEVVVGDQALENAADAYSAGNYAAAVEKAEEAKLYYGLVLKTAWESYVTKARDLAAAERQRALDLKANVAARNEFNSAEAVYNRANTALRAESHEEAGRLYEDCKPMFGLSAQLAIEKQLAADEALKRADQRVAESDEVAKSAETILGGAQ